MTAIAVTLSAPVYLVPGSRLEEKLAEQVDSPGVPQDPYQVIADLNARTDGVAVRLTERSGNFGPGLRLYGPGYVVWASPSTRRDSYRINGIYPMRGNDHRLLAGGYLRVKPPVWNLALKLSAVPAGMDAGWSHLEQAWLKSSGARPDAGTSPAMPAHRAEFLDVLDELIDAGQSINVERQQDGEGFPFRDVVATGGRRDGARSVYDFRLTGDRVPEANAYLQISGPRRLRGQVTRLDGATVTVRFDEPVDWSTLNRQGVLLPAPNTTVYRRQREAVERLRTNSTAGARLLEVLTDHRTHRFIPSTELPVENLDPEQLAAFQSALTVPDVLAVLGPPGTGKTRTIVEITRACAQASPPQRVLVTSHTHRAVDNVLERLPDDLVIIRVGDENRVTRDGLPYLLAHQAADHRGEILGPTAQRIEEYRELDTAAQWTPELYRRADVLTAALGQAVADRRALDRIRRAKEATGRRQHVETTARIGEIETESTDREARAKQFSARADQARFGFRAKRHRAKAESLIEHVGRLHAEHGELTSTLRTLEAALAADWRDDPAVASAALAWTQSQDACQGPADDAVMAARTVHSVCARLGADLACPEFPEADDIAETERRVTGFCAWLRSALPMLLARAKLLNEWYEAASEDSEHLHAELIRYADVIAATCSGTARTDELGDIELDLAIVDEAGQIGLPDALVPLVRAKRAVLVGDDRQLPPVLDHDVKQWGEEKADPRTLALLTKSALELLVEGLPQSNIVQLTRQRRMPADVCAFISDRFYGGALTTEGERRVYRDPLFARPMVFVETSYLSEAVRWERSGGRGENWKQPGCSNEAEAELLAELAALYHRSGTEWAVIVPYRAQVARVIDKIAARIRNIDAARHGVGTVDSFQGGEKDVILYGFTRSNSRGDVGFLKELRRINVALSRVRCQLVMVGDPTTLAEARDPGFRELTLALREHLTHSGELREYGEVLDQVRKLNEQGSGV